MEAAVRSTNCLALPVSSCDNHPMLGRRNRITAVASDYQSQPKKVTLERLGGWDKELVSRISQMFDVPGERDSETASKELSLGKCEHRGNGKKISSRFHG